MAKKKKPTKKSTVKSRFKKRKKESEKKNPYSKRDIAGTIHDSKNILIEYFKYEDKQRKDKEEKEKWTNARKALYKFNKIIRDKREELENSVRSGKGVKKNNDILFGREKIELNIPKSIRASLDKIYPRIFKFKEFRLKEIGYFTATNKINYFSGKPFYFVVDTGFKKYFVSSNELKKKVLKTEENIAKYFLDLFEKSFKESLKTGAKHSLSKREFKLRQKVYNKILRAIEHNKRIIEKTAKKITGDTDEQEYPIMFDMYDDVIELSFAGG